MSWGTLLPALFNNKELSDVKFIIENKEAESHSFYGIKAIFAAKSEVFKTMLYGSSSMRDHAFIVDNEEDPIQWIIQKIILDNDHGFVTYSVVLMT